MKKLLLGLFVIFIYSSSVLAQTLLDSVLKEGIGARPMGMGGAFTAVANDSNAIFYNPAGLGSIDFQYTKGFGDIQNANSRMDDYYLLAFKAFGTGAWRRENLAGDVVNVGAISLGSMGGNGIGWGFTTKSINGTISGNTINAWSLDVGMKMPIDPRLDFGIILQDIMKNNLNLPATIRPGICYKLPIGGIAAVDAEIQNIRSEKGADIYMHYGIERPMTENLIIRAGWGRDRYSGGVTAAFTYFTADFAVMSHPYAGQPIYMMSFRLGD